jgi:hypothetical protein
MWVKKSPQEIEQDKIQYQKKKNIRALLCFIVPLFMMISAERSGSCTYPLGGANHRELKSWHQIQTELPLMLIVAGICGFFGYKLDRYSASRWDIICTKCDKVKRKDSVLQCTCGEYFQDFILYKWVGD